MKVIRGAEIGTDHLLLVGDTQILHPRKEKPKVYRKIDISKLQAPEKKIEYADALDQKLLAINMEESIDETWGKIKDAILETAEATCGTAVVSSKGKRSKWWSARVKAAVVRKKEAWKQYQRAKNAANWELYIRRRNEAKRVVRTAKKKSWEEFGRSLQSDYKDNSKKFWKRIKTIKGNPSKPVRNVKDEVRQLLSKNDEILKRWQRHYSEMFSSEIEEWSVDRQRSDTEEYECTIWEEDIEWAVRKMKISKAAGRDGISPELIKFGGQELLQSITELLPKIDV